MAERSETYHEVARQRIVNTMSYFTGACLGTGFFARLFWRSAFVINNPIKLLLGSIAISL